MKTKFLKGGNIMHIDGKSFILGAIAGGCIVIFNAAVSVAKDQIKKNKEIKEKEAE
jgi:predicted small secreted protein